MRRSTPALLLAVATLSATAVPATARRMWAGARLGIAGSRLGGDFDDLVPSHRRTSFSASGVFGANITRLLAIEPEVA